jgi:uncharacterized membrane protein
MAELETTVAAYNALATAEADWSALEQAAQAHQIEIADAALVENSGGKPTIVHRQSHHGWGKGAIAGAVVGILFPPSVIGGAAVGAGGGALISHMMRKLGRGKVKDLGHAFDSGTIAIVVVAPAASTVHVTEKLGGAITTETQAGSTTEEVQQEIGQAFMGPVGQDVKLV